MVVDAFSSTASTTFNLLQGHTVTIAAKHAHVNSLQTNLMQMVNCAGPLSVGKTPSLCSAKWYLQEMGRISVKLSDVRAFLNNLRTFARAKLEKFGQNDVNELVKEVARLYTMSIASINTIRVERDENNGAADNNNSVLPPVLAHQVAVLSHAEFFAIVCTHTERLLSTFYRRDVDAASVVAIVCEMLEIELTSALLSSGVLDEPWQRVDDQDDGGTRSGSGGRGVVFVVSGDQTEQKGVSDEDEDDGYNNGVCQWCTRNYSHQRGTSPMWQPEPYRQNQGYYLEEEC
jgi:hypothetical protein